MTNYLLRRMNRELRRMRYRAIANAALIIVSVAVYIGMAGMMPNAERGLDNRVDEMRLSDYMVHVNSARESEVSGLAAIPGVERADYRLQVSSHAYYTQDGKEKSVAASLFGVEPSRRPEVNIPDIVEGHYFQDNTTGTAIVEKYFAERSNLHPGDRISVKTEKGMMDIRIVGMMLCPEYIFLPMDPGSLIPSPGNLAVIYLPIQELRSAFNLSDGFVNEFTFIFERGQNADALRSRIDANLSDDTILYSVPKDRVYGYALIKEDLSEGKQFVGLFLLIVFVVSFFIVYISFVRIVEEQRREIGVLKALGYSGKSIMFSYLYMAALIGLGGSLAGILIGIPLSMWLSEFYLQMAVGVRITGFRLITGSLIVGALFGPITGCLASGLAVLSTVRMETQDALRGLEPKSFWQRRPFLQSNEKANRNTTGLHRKGKANGKTTELFRKEKANRKASELHWKWNDTSLLSRLGASYITLYTFRTMWRHRWKTIFTTAAVAGSILMGSLSILMWASFNNSLSESVNEQENWDLVVEYSLPLNESQVKELKSPYITESVQVARLGGEWERGKDRGFAIIIGLESGQRLHRFSLSGGRKAVGPNEIMMNSRTASKHDLHTGDTITLTIQNSTNSFRIVGLVKDMLGDIYMDMGALENLTGRGIYSGMYLNVEAGKREEVKQSMLSSPLVSAVQTKKDVNSGLLEFMSSYSKMIYMMTLIGIFMAAAILANTVYIGVLERKAEYGQLRAIGYSMRDVSKSVLTEILTIVSMGAAAAAPLSYLVLVGYEGAFQQFFPLYTTILYPSDWLGYLGVVAVTFGLAVLSALPSIRLIKRMDVAKTVSGARFG